MKKQYKNTFNEIISFKNLFLAYKKARKGKTKKNYVIKFEKDLEINLLDLQFELKSQTYKPEPLKTFILCDPKTRKIAKSEFRDRVIHHAICNVLEPIFNKTFIYDSCANQKGKGNIFAIKRFDKFKYKVSHNGKLNGWINKNQVKGFCLKADIKHYFQEINHEILINLIKKKIRNKKTISLIEKIIKANFEIQGEREISGKAIPLGNLTSRFFANIYLNELDYFVKHNLKSKFYIRYVDDFVILNTSKNKLVIWKKEINRFLKEELKLQLHPDKTKIISLSKGIDFVGFRNFYLSRLIRLRSKKKINQNIFLFSKKNLDYLNLMEIFQGWQAHAKWANSFKLRKNILKKIYLTKNL